MADPVRARALHSAAHLEVDRDLCQGHGVCASEAPDVFGIEPQERKVVLLQETPGPEQRERVELAVRHCPTGALAIEE